jgi:glycosyltransferase involved in cell wall biosynthesis
MRIVRVIAKLEPGGAQLGAAILTRELRARGIETAVLAGEATADGVALFERHGVAPQVWGRGAGLQYRPDPRFARWLEPRLAGADVVHGQMFGAWWAAARAAAPGVPLVASEHNAVRWPGAPRQPEMREALRRIDLVLAHGPATLALFRRLGVPDARLDRGISPIPVYGGPPAPRLPQPRICFAGRLHEEKGPDLLIEALALRPAPPATLILGEGPLEADLRRLVRRHGLQRAVRFCGWRARPGRWIKGASALVVPSRHEAWSQAAVLGMFMGVPVIGTGVEGLPDTLSGGRGVIAAPDDPAALAEAIGDVLTGSRMPDLEAARRYAAGFAPERVAEHYHRLYAQLAREPLAHAA